MEKYNINYELIIVNRVTQDNYDTFRHKFKRIGEYGCYLSHMYCLKDAIKNNYENIIIFEDDIVLHKNFHNLFENVMNIQKYNILMLGAADFHFLKENNLLVDKTKGIYRPSLSSRFLYTTHAIYYSKDAVNMMYNYKIDNISHMDYNFVHFIENSPENLYVCSPNLVLAELSTTNIEHNFWIGYKPVFDSYYYRKCFSNNLKFNDYNFIYLELVKTIVIDQTLSYQNNMINCIEEKFSDPDIKNKIKERIVYDFFTNADLLKMIKKDY